MYKPTVLVVNPNTSHEMTAAIDRVAQVAAGSSAKVVTIRSHNGPYTIEGALDAALAATGMLEVVAAYKDPFDAVVVACFSDSGVEALRMLVRVPVIGIGAASFMQAACISQHFAIVTPQAGPPGRYAAVAAAMGLSRQFVGTYQTPLSVADFEQTTRRCWRLCCPMLSKRSRMGPIVCCSAAPVSRIRSTISRRASV